DRRVARDLLADLEQLRARGFHRFGEALDFGVDRIDGDRLCDDVRQLARQHESVADADAVAHAGAGEREHHSSSPKRLATRRVKASIALTSSLPCAQIFSSEPFAAASIITPMMLFAFTCWASRATVMSHLNSPAKLTSLAAARACRPSL